MKYSLIVSDYDGTLIKKDGSISEEQISVVNKYVSLGGKFTVITGRMTTSILPLVRKLGLKGYVSSFNGGELAEIESGKILYSIKIKNELAVKVYKVIESENAYAHGYYEGEYFTEKRTLFTDFYEKITGVKATVISEKLSEHFSNNGLDTNKILVMDEKEKLDKVMLALEPFMKELNVIRSNDFQIEITEPTATKGNALKYIAKTFNVDMKKTIAVGDGGNDCSMIEAAGLGVAVNNAEEATKKVADVVLPYTNEQDAIRKIIELYAIK